jgi:glycosyltransferase involved in cell wall biosynthesis
MRIALVAHGFPLLERTGVENHCAALAAAFARGGHTVEVFVPRAEPGLPELSQRRELRDGYAITWLTLNQPARNAAEHLERPFAARAFGQFLDRERPQVVHFQHVRKLGVALLEEVGLRALPCVYTAHDYEPICHRTTLLRPDFERCTTLGDPRACARCDRAVSYLNALGSLGDYHAGALAGQLDREQSEALRQLLMDTTEPGSASSVRVERERAQLDARRARAFAQVDLVLAPTRFLADRLVEGGLARERIELHSCGIDTARLAELAPPRTSAPLRFGFVGGLEKHKGPHVLLEAWRSAGSPGGLALWGDSTDRVYVDALRKRASELGARWGGAFDARQLPQVLEQVDVLVVPSLWFENAPFVIREAFAAKRPVIASRVGALGESVRDGIDGLLVEPGDAEALAEALRRCSREPGLLARLGAGIGPVVRIEEQAVGLLARYGELLRARSEARTGARRGARTGAANPAPPSVAPFAARHAALRELPSRELFARVLEGLSSLRGTLGVSPADTALLARTLAGDSKVQELLRDGRNESEWLRELLAEARARHARDAERIEAGDASAAALARSQRELLREHEALRGELQRALADAEALRAELDRRGRALEQAARAQEAARIHVEELERLRIAQARQLAELDQHERWLRTRAAELLAGVTREASSSTPRELPDPPLLPRMFEEAAERLARLQRELEWRRSQMSAARDDGGALFRRLLRRAELGRRMEQWPKSGEGEPR